MSDQDPTQSAAAPGPGRPPTDEELAAAYEAQLKQLRVEDVLVQTVVSLLNLGGRKAGLAPGTEDERDLEQLHQAVEGVRALLPLCEPILGPDAKQIREALSQLQMAYAQLSGQSADAPAGEAPPEPEQAKPEAGGTAQSSGRLWVPGQ